MYINRRLIIINKSNNSFSIHYLTFTKRNTKKLLMGYNHLHDNNLTSRYIDRFTCTCSQPDHWGALPM